MRVHHLDCVSACPLGGALMDGRSGADLAARLACHCLLVEAGSQLVLVDTGYGLRDVADPRSRLSKFFLTMLRPQLREEMTAICQIERLGFDPRDVRHIVLTHLDFDHAGGLDDFPWAEVHMLAQERDAAFAQATALDRMRYRPQQWGTRWSWRVYPSSAGEPWFGFDCVRQLGGVPDDILFVPLVGHTVGHAGVAVRREEGWLLLAGDAYFHEGEMDLARPHCPPGLRAYQTMMEKDRKLRLWNQERLRQLKRMRGGDVWITSSHDVAEFERLARRGFDVPAGAGARQKTPAIEAPASARGADGKSRARTAPAPSSSHGAW